MTALASSVLVKLANSHGTVPQVTTSTRGRSCRSVAADRMLTGSASCRRRTSMSRWPRTLALSAYFFSGSTATRILEGGLVRRTTSSVRLSPSLGPASWRTKRSRSLVDGLHVDQLDEGRRDGLAVYLGQDAGHQEHFRLALEDQQDRRAR